MTETSLHGRHILVAEDEYLIADDLRDALTAAGAEVIGPVATVAEALACIEASEAMDAAILDVNLRGEMIFPAADALTARGVPFIFATGYDSWSFPERFAGTTRLEKPITANKVTEALEPLLRPR